MGFENPWYRVPEVRPQGEVGPLRVDTPAGAFGPSGEQMQQAGQRVQAAASPLDRLAEEADSTRAEQAVNGYIEQKQKLLYFNNDAFLRQKGQGAIDAGPGALKTLDDLRTSTLGGLANERQRRMVKSALDHQYDEAMGLIGRHTDQQLNVLQADVARGRGALIANQAALDWNDDEKLTGLALAAEGTAREQAKQQGLTGTPAEGAMVTDARSTVYAAAIQQRLDNNQPRQALALYDKVKDGLSGKVNGALALKIKSTRTDMAADDLIAAATPNARRDEVRQFWAGKGYGPEAAAALTGGFQEESGFEPGRVNAGDGRDGSDSIGAGQWNGDRARALLKFAQDNKLDPRALKTQLEFASHELDTSEKATGEALKGAKSLDEASRVAIGYFRPGGWTMQNPTGAESYERRRANAQAAYDSGVGFDKANVQSVADRVLNSSAPLEVRQAAYAKVERQGKLMESARSAEIRGLDDHLEATTMAIAVAPSSVARGTLADIAARYDAVGEKSKAMNARILATLEGTLYDFASAPRAAQELAVKMLTGKAKDLFSGLMAGDKEAGAAAASSEKALRSAIGAGTSVESLQDKIKDTIGSLLKAGHVQQAQEFADYAEAEHRAQYAGKMTPVGMESFISGLKDQIAQGHQDNVTLLSLQAAQRIQQQQHEAFGRDAFQAGVDKYGLTVQPMNWQGNIAQQLADRTAAARQISANEGNLTVLPFSANEIATLRNTLADGNALQQETLMRQLAVMPPDAIPHVAAALAGKGEGDALSRSYAAALSFFASTDPQDQATARLVLDGAQRRKEMGDAGRKPSMSGDAIQDALQTRMGNAFIDMGRRVPGVVADAVESAYLSLAAKAGRQGEKFADDLFTQAMDAVIGRPITINGQAMLPPKGADEYQARNGLQVIAQSDLGELKTLNGSAVSAEKVRRYGILTNAGGDGQYFVQIPDPANRGAPGYVMRQDGRPYVLDLKPLVERAKAADMIGPNPNDPLTVQRRARDAVTMDPNK